LAVPHNPNAYKHGDETKINEIGYKVVLSVVDAMEALCWVNRKKGFWRDENTSQTTELLPAGALLEEFKRVGLAWQELEPISEVIIRRNYDEQTKKKYKQKLPQSDDVRKMAVNLRRINKFLTQQCICLMISNDSFERLAKELTFDKKRTLYRFNYQDNFSRYLDFSMVQLRRIFSRDSMKQGGRFYCGWWQFLPKKYRTHITINYMRTVEVDYSGLHPLMMYHIDNLTPPKGDMYDIGIWKTEKERERKRPIVKEFFNAIINDEYDFYRMSKENKKIIGLTNAKLKKLLSDRHHQIAHKFNSGYGLTLQYEDSKIAERVMLILLEQGITCLPIHDSFIVQSEERAKVILAMNRAYKERFDLEIDLNSTFVFDKDSLGRRKYSVELPIPFDKFGEVDRMALYKMHQESFHNQYCHHWRMNQPF
jgi:hypothetical protein